MAGSNGGRRGRGLGQEDDAIYEEHVLQTDAGVETSAQYEKFKSPVYPSFRRGFPRRYVDITPDEILYDPTRIMSRGIRARIWGTGQTVLYQPSVETEAMTQIQRMDCPPTQAPFECPPPFSQLPVVKQQIHLQPSRDAEIFRTDTCVDVPASADGIVPGTASYSFDTFQQLRTIIKWTQMLVYDALCPSMVTVGVLVDGSSIKWMANPAGSVVGSGGITYNTVSTPNAQDFSCLPDCCENTLIEITDRHHVEVVFSNLAPVDRRVEFCLWGWIESITMWDQAVKH